MTNQRWALLASLGAAVSAAAACSGKTVGSSSNHAVAGEAGARSEAGRSPGSGGGGSTGSAQAEGGSVQAEGGTAGHPDATCGVALGGAGGDLGDARLTRQLPDEPFVLERLPADHEAYDESAYPTLPDDGSQFSIGPGPWTLNLGADGAGFSGHVALFDTSAVSSLLLEPEGDHYRFAAKATLVNYTYAADVVPGICVDRQTKARLLDDDGDCVADRLLLSGTVRSLGLRGGDYEDDCGTEDYPIHLEARTLSQSELKPALEAASDPLRPMLHAPALYSEATATLETEDGTVIDAEPLLVDDVIYGFYTDVGLTPGSTATWHFDGRALGQTASKSTDVLVTFGDWPLVNDGSFESWDDAWLQKSWIYRNDPEFDPPIAGAYSLSLRDGGTIASIRFVQPPGKTKLRFLANTTPYGGPPDIGWQEGLAIDYAAPGEAAVSGTPTATNVCDAHAAYCSCNAEPECERVLFDYTVDIAAAAEPRELLLRFKNFNSDWAVQAQPILIDDLRFE